MNIRLIVDFKEVQLSKREAIAISYGVNRLTDIESRQGYYSNTFRLPKTHTNLEIFGFPNQVNATDTKRYQRLTAWIEVDGIVVIYGFAQLQSVKDEMEVVMKGGNADWISLMRGKYISDCELSDLDHYPTTSVVKANRQNTYSDGFVYSDIDYGYWKDAKNDSIRHYHHYPSIYLHRIFNQSFEDIGLSVTSEINDDALFQKMAIPFSNEKPTHSEAWQTDKYFKVRFGLTAVPVLVSAIDILPIVAPYYDNGSHVNVTTNSYDPGDKVVEQWFNMEITYTVNSLGINNAFKVYAVSDNVLKELMTINPSSVGTFTATKRFRWWDHGSSLKIMPGSAGLYSVDIDIVDGYLESVEVGKEYFRESQWSFAANLPKILQTDMVKYVLNAFGAIITTDVINSTVTIKMLDTLNDNGVEDWSNKIDKIENPNHSFDYGGFKKTNSLEYTINTDDIHLTLDEGLGDYDIIRATDDVETKVIYKSPFSFSKRIQTTSDLIEKAAIDNASVTSRYCPIIYKSEVTGISITNTGLVTVSSGASNLRVGMGILLYDLDAFLFEGDGYYPDLDYWANERVFIIASINSDTEFQLEGDFHYQAVTSGKYRSGVMVDKFNRTYVSLNNLGDVAVGDEVSFYNTSAATTINGDSSRPTNGSSFLVRSVEGSRCITIGEIPTTVDGNSPPVVDDSETITTGEVRVIKPPTFKDAKPRIGVVSVYEDADNALTLFDNSNPSYVETYVSELTYDDITWEALVNAYWQTLSYIIKTPQVAMMLMRLSASDINQLDFTKPKYIDYFGCYFYLSYVDQYRVDQVDSTMVELVRLP